MTKKHNVSGIISDKLYCTIKDAIERSLIFELDCWRVKVNDDNRTVTVTLPLGLKKHYSSGIWTEINCREVYFIPFCENFYYYWDANPFKSIEFDDKTLLITLHFDTDDIVKELEDIMETLEDDEILIRRGGIWCVTKFDYKDFNECFLGRFYFDGKNKKKQIKVLEDEYKKLYEHE